MVNAGGDGEILIGSWCRPSKMGHEGTDIISVCGAITKITNCCRISEKLARSAYSELNERPRSWQLLLLAICKQCQRCNDTCPSCRRRISCDSNNLLFPGIWLMDFNDGTINVLQKGSDLILSYEVQYSMDSHVRNLRPRTWLWLVFQSRHRFISLGQESPAPFWSVLGFASLTTPEFPI